MKKGYLRKVFLLFILSVFFDYGIAAGESKLNTLTSGSESLRLKNWQILKDPAPKQPLSSLPDSLWKSFDSNIDEEMYSEGNWLLKTEIIIDNSSADNIIWGLFPVNFITAYEIYWDGIKIGQNGKIGMDSNDEQAGAFIFNIGMSPNLTSPGKHTLLIRLSDYSNYSNWKWFYGDLIIGHYDDVLKKMFQSGYYAFFISGIFSIAFLFNLFLYITRQRKIEHLLFSLICLLVTLDFIVTQAPLLIRFSTMYSHFLYFFYQLNTLSFVILLPTFFIYLFSLPRKTIGIIFALNIVIFVFFTDIWNIFDILSLSILIQSSAAALWALLLRREESIIISAGLILSWIAYFFNFAFEGLATVMVICTSFSVARQFAWKEKTEKEAQLKSARLENELLKKNINPHFVLNTLTSIIAWLRRDSNSAIKLIESLADEFRMINQISALKLIPIGQEIDLCRAHLKIMSYRKGADYVLETFEIDEKDTVPPMIFHTLIENGLTHGYENKIKGVFMLKMIKTPEGTKYILSNDGDFNPEDSKGSTGFGLKYIKVRLEESYPGRWEIASNKLENGWESIIEIRGK